AGLRVFGFPLDLHLETVGCFCLLRSQGRLLNLTLLLNVRSHRAETLAHATEFSAEWLKPCFECLHGNHHPRDAGFLIRKECGVDDGDVGRRWRGSCLRLDDDGKRHECGYGDNNAKYFHCLGSLKTVLRRRGDYCWG